MKKFLTVLALSACAIAPIAVLAAPVPVPGDITGVPSNLIVCCGPKSLVDVIINWLFVGLVMAAVICFIIAGFYFVTAQGDSTKTKTARNFIMYAIVGLVVGFAAKGLILLIAGIVGTATGGTGT